MKRQNAVLELMTMTVSEHFFLAVFICFVELMERRKQAAADVQPPDMESLNAARELRMKEMAMEALLKEIITYAIFVLIVFFLSYQARDSDSFIYAENIKNTFFRNSPTFDGVSLNRFVSSPKYCT